MSFKSPHDAREHLWASALGLTHDFKLRSMGLSASRVTRMLKGTREIDICARLAQFFGPAAHLAAQGTSDIDLQVDGPTIRAEVKFLYDRRNAWKDVVKDWDWLLKCTSAGGEFEKRAFLVFFPGTDARKFTNLVSVPKGHGTQYSLADFAPLVTLVEPEMPARGVNQRLRFRSTISRVSYIRVPANAGPPKAVRIDVVGATTGHPVWCALMTRVVANSIPAGLAPSADVTISNTPILVP